MSRSVQEQQTSAAFSKQAPVFDQIDEENSLIVWMRRRVHREVMAWIRKDDHLLELNCGTGIDALYFAGQGIKVHATDNAAGMLDQLSRKVAEGDLQDKISVQRCSFNKLEDLGTRLRYNYVFSDFGGLNCTDRLDKVLTDIDRLLEPGGRFTLVIMPRICPWELLMVFRGYFRTAFRRFRKGGAPARVEGLPFQCYYYDPGFIIRQMGTGYRLCSLKALALTVPPPYVEHFMERHPRLFSWLERWEDKLCGRAPFNRWGDHYMITMEKRQAL